MTNYVGELQRVTVTSADFQGVAITPDDIASMKVSIRKASTEVVAETDMEWSEEESLWYHLWVTRVTPSDDNSDPLPPGNYKVRARLLDLDGHESVEYLTHRLQKRPF